MIDPRFPPVFGRRFASGGIINHSSMWSAESHSDPVGDLMRLFDSMMMKKQEDESSRARRLLLLYYGGIFYEKKNVKFIENIDLDFGQWQFHWPRSGGKTSIFASFKDFSESMSVMSGEIEMIAIPGNIRKLIKRLERPMKKFQRKQTTQQKQQWRQQERLMRKQRRPGR